MEQKYFKKDPLKATDQGFASGIYEGNSDIKPSIIAVRGTS